MLGWLKLKLTLKEDFCDVSVTAFFANFFMHSPKRYLNEHIQSLSVPNALSESKICKRRALASLLCGSSPGEANRHLFHLIFLRSMITVSWDYWLCFTQFRLRWMTGFVVRSNGVLLTFVYFYNYQLGETAWTSSLYFLSFTEVARFEINVETLLIACDANVALDSGLSLGAWNLKLTTPDWKKQSVKGRNLLIEISFTKVFKFVRKCGLLIRGR